MTRPKLPAILIGLVIALGAGLGVYVVATLDVRGPADLPTGDLDRFDAPDPALVHYAETAAFAARFDVVRAVAAGPDDRVYVAGDRAVRVFSPAGAVASTWPLGAEVRGLAVADDGTLYTVTADEVVVVGPDGTRKASWRRAGALFTSVAVAGESLFVADANARVVLRYDTAGTLLGEIAKADPRRGIEGIVLPSAYFDVAVGPDNLLRVTNPGRLRVEVYSLDGEPLGHWGAGSADLDGFQGCCNPAHVAALPGGRIVTSEKGLPRIKVYANDGALVSVVAGPASFAALRCPTGDCTKGRTLDLATDSRGRVLALDPASKTVRIFTKKETP